MKSDYKQGYSDGIAACSSFLVIAHDLPSIAEDMKQYVLPNRNWKKRFFDLTGLRLKRHK